jgi:hypothetical protein
VPLTTPSPKENWRKQKCVFLDLWQEYSYKNHKDMKALEVFCVNPLTPNISEFSLQSKENTTPLQR